MWASSTTLCVFRFPSSLMRALSCLSYRSAPHPWLSRRECLLVASSRAHCCSSWTQSSLKSPTHSLRTLQQGRLLLSIARREGWPAPPSHSSISLVHCACHRADPFQLGPFSDSCSQLDWHCAKHRLWGIRLHSRARLGMRSSQTLTLQLYRWQSQYCVSQVPRTRRHRLD